MKSVFRLRALIRASGSCRMASSNYLHTLLSTVSFSTSVGVTQQSEGSIYRVTLDRPEVYNAFSTEMFHSLAGALRQADADPNSKMTVLTGKGKLFTAGNDLNNMGRVDSAAQLERTADALCAAVDDCFRAFIEHEKPLIALVNGPAYGIGSTCLPLCDVALASERALFNTPFTPLGYSPEGCSTYTFPKILGTSLAQEMLLFSRTLNSSEALNAGLISRVFPADQFQAEAEKLLQTWAALPAQSLRINKMLVRGLDKAQLLEVHKAEMESLKVRFKSEESLEATRRFLEGRKKPKA